MMKSHPGFTLIESLVFLFLFALISVTFFQTYSIGTRLIIESKNRLGATALANQKMEIIRSIAYDAIGTTTGIPAGDLAENETISVNTVKYQVHTFVQYVDDAFDGTAALGTDVIPTDYKRVRLTIAWGNQGTDQTVVIFGNFSPKGIETGGGGGVLSINVLNGAGNGVVGATVHIVNAAAGVNVTGATDATGNLTLPGAPVGTEDYVITVSKAGYYGATTYPPYPTTAYNPVDVHASVVAVVLNQKTMVADQSSDITLTTEDPFGNTLPNIGYTLSGGRILGTDTVTSAAVYGFSSTDTTDASGQATYVAESPGQYTLSVSNASYELLRLSLEGAAANAFSAVAGVPTDVTAFLIDRNIGSIKVMVKDQGTSNPLAGASVQATNAAAAYDVTETTDAFGQAYFPSALPALSAGAYDLTISCDGYAPVNSIVNVAGVLQTVTINLTP